MVKGLFSSILVVVFFAVGLVSCQPTQNTNWIQNISIPPGSPESLGWSVDGQLILFEFTPRPGPSRNHQIVTMKPDGSDFKVLLETLDGFLISGPQSWCNNKIGFDRSELLPSASFVISTSLKSIDLDGSNEQSVLPAVGYSTQVAWDSKNCRVAFEIKEKDNTRSLMLFDPSNNSKQKLLALPDKMWFENIEWSRSGEKIVYNIKRDLSDRRNTSQLEIVDLKTNSRQVLTDVSLGSSSHPTWSPDDKQIAFVINDEKYQSRIALFNVDDPKTLRILDAPNIFPVDLAWSPVADKLVVISLNGIGEYSVHVIDLAKARFLEKAKQLP